MKGCNQEQLKIRNILLDITQFILWAAFVSFFLIFLFISYFENVGYELFVIVTLSFLFLVRFENWVDPYWALDKKEGGLEDDQDLQKKFFSSGFHKEGDKNPFW
ncbi:MAG: hypothetical protein WCI93_00315 [bacterium]